MRQNQEREAFVNTKPTGHWILMARCDKHARTQLFDVMPYARKG